MRYDTTQHEQGHANQSCRFMHQPGAARPGSVNALSMKQEGGWGCMHACESVRKGPHKPSLTKAVQWHKGGVARTIPRLCLHGEMCTSGARSAAAGSVARALTSSGIKGLAVALLGPTARVQWPSSTRCGCASREHRSPSRPSALQSFDFCGCKIQLAIASSVC